MVSQYNFPPGRWFNMNYRVSVILNASGAAFLTGLTKRPHKAGDVWEGMFHDLLSTFGRFMETSLSMPPFKGAAVFFSDEEFKMGVVPSPETCGDNPWDDDKARYTDDTSPDQ